MTATRWLILGKLRVLSPIAIRTGSEEGEWPMDASGREPNEIDPRALGGLPPIRGIELDHRWQPFVPGTALKGLVRAYAAQVMDPASLQLVRALLGDLPAPTGPTDTTQSPTGGVAEFLNAFLPQNAWGDERPAIRGRTALHEGTRTAEDRQLQHDRLVPPETCFAVRILLSRADEAQVSLLLGLLAGLDGTGQHSALGSGTTQGDGLIRWEPSETLRFGPAEVATWLASAPGKDWSDCAAPVTITPRALGLPATALIDIPLAIQVVGNFLVSALDKKVEGKETSYPRRPLRLTSREIGTAFLPGSSLDGALRAQARRIFRTMSGDFVAWDENDRALPACFETLFGSSAHASLLEVGWLEAPNMSPSTQEFVALDRLAGGAADEKKFNLTAFEAPRLTGRLRLILRRRVTPELTGKSGMTPETAISAAAIGLLALVLKDLACGDIALGHATRKGYGSVGAVEFGGMDWSAFLLHMGEQVRLQMPELLPEAKDARQVLQGALTALEAEAAAWSRTRAGVA